MKALVINCSPVRTGATAEIANLVSEQLSVKELLKKCKEIGYKEIKLFPMKNNTASVNIMLKNGGQIIGDFKSQKHIIRFPFGNGLQPPVDTLQAVDGRLQPFFYVCWKYEKHTERTVFYGTNKENSS